MVQCSTENPCVAMQLLAQRITTEEERSERLEKLIESMRNRLPVWATLLFTTGGGLIGLLAGHAKF